jgi:hypothetical protein
LQETAIFLGQGEVFRESSNLLERLSGVSLSDKQIEKLCHHYGGLIESADNETVTTRKVNELHYGMVDGSYLMTREDGWKETKLGRVFKETDNYAIK